MSRFFFQYIPQNRWLYRFCKAYVDRCRGENNVDMESNGEVSLMRTYLPASGVVFDVGANVGEWASQALKINDKLNLHCFEPAAGSFEKLLARNFPKNVTCNNMACGAAGGTAELFSYGESSMMNSLYRRSGLEYVGLTEPKTSSEVIVESVDAYCARKSIQRIDYLKIDVEGHELKVIEGAAEMFKAGNIKVAQFEYGGTYIDSRVLLRDVWYAIAGYNPKYRFYKLHGRKLHYSGLYSQDLENFQFQNWAVILE